MPRRHALASLLGLAFLPWTVRAAPPALLLAQSASDHVDPAGYLVSEKYDGVRALWDGRTLAFRSGRAVRAPAWFTAGLPPHPLDGELWLGRGRFDALSGIVRRTEPVHEQWRQVRYMAFELPGAAGTFAQRAERLREIAEAARATPLRAVPQRQLAGGEDLRRLLREVVDAGGEGLMLHRADAPYLTGRSDALLKLKPQADAEAQVVAVLPGRGKYAGMMGALELRTPAGRHFRLGSGFPDAMRRDPPPIGSVVTYAYRDLTPGGLPRFASFVRMHEAL